MYQGPIPISDLTLCQKILTHPAWPDRVRPHAAIHMSSFGKPLGLILGCGQDYNTARRMSSRILNHIGFYNTSKLEQLVVPQVPALLDTLRELSSNNKAGTEGVLWCPKRKLNHFTLTVMWTLLFGSKCPRDDGAIEKFVNHVDDCNRKFKVGGTGWMGMGFLTKLMGNYMRFKAWYQNSQEYYEIFRVGSYYCSY